MEEFSVVEHAYRKTSRPAEPRPSSSVKEWDFYLAKMDVLNPPLFILDTDGFVKPVRKNFSVEAFETLDVLDTLTSVPKKVKDRIFTAATHYGIVLEDENTMGDRADALARSYLYYRAIPQLNDPSFLRKIDWPQFVQEIVSFQVDKEPALLAAHEAHLLRGLSPQINPHGIQSTNGGTGKGISYEMTGISFRKVAVKNFLGYAQSLEEIYSATIHGTELTVNIDQIESQYANQIIRFLLNVMEQGKDYGAAAVRFMVTSDSRARAHTHNVSFFIF